MKLIEHIGEPALLELLAEECTELAHAALKLARVERGENPTPKPLPECQDAVIEEWVDVLICLKELCEAPWDDDDKWGKIFYEKENRMKRRLTGEEAETYQTDRRDEG